VPEHVAKVMTYPERVTSHNRDKLIKCIQNGHDVHPGANYVRPRGEHAIAKRVVGHNK
jgi:DNA-directed RNA polymerase III subunit RPC1